MTKTREIYRCTICGNVVEVVNPGAVLSCCGQPMMLMKENTTDGAKEKLHFGLSQRGTSPKKQPRAKPSFTR